MPRCAKQDVGSHWDTETRALYVNRGNNPPSSLLLVTLTRDLHPGSGITLQGSCGLVGKSSGKRSKEDQSAESIIWQKSLKEPRLEKGS